MPGGDELPPIINRIAKQFEHVVLTQDWHPRGHKSFASSHPGRKPHEVIHALLWSANSVAGSLRARHARR